MLTHFVSCIYGFRRKIEEKKRKKETKGIKIYENLWILRDECPVIMYFPNDSCEQIIFTKRCLLIHHSESCISNDLSVNIRKYCIFRYTGQFETIMAFLIRQQVSHNVITTSEIHNINLSSDFNT